MLRFIRNIISYINYLFLKIIFGHKSGVRTNSLIFMNTGSMGDVMISSILMENESLFRNYENLYFICRSEYSDLFFSYKGLFNLIFINIKRYRFNIFYRIYFLNKLHKINARRFYHITAERGIINDEISLLSGSHDVFTTCSRHTYLGNFFGKLNDKKYTGILYPDVQNEYEKHSLLIKEITGVNEIEIYNRHFFSFDKNIFYPEYITIAPLSSDKRKQWSIEKYKELADIISQKYNVELIADKKNINNLNYIKSDNPNINFRITNLKELISLINYSSLFIGNDSGPAHIAFKLNKKSIIIIKEEHYNNCFPFDLKNNNVRYITENKNGNITVGDISEILKHLL